MPRRRLTDIVVNNLPIPATGTTDFWDENLPRFGVRCSRGGTRSYILNENKRRVVLGRVGLTPLKQARDEAKRRLAAKYFPNTTKLTHEAIQEYMAAKLTEHRPGSRIVYQSYLKRLENRPLSDLNTKYVYSILPTAKSAANLAFSVYKAWLSWCVERDYLQTNPLLGKSKPYKTKSRERLLTDDEIKLIWKESYNHNAFGVLVRTLILSGQRLNQIASFHPSWLANQTIVFPASSMKSGTEHTIPLTAQVKKELQHHSQLSHNQIFVGMKKFREALPTIPHWTLHDFRRYFSSCCSRLKPRVDIDVVEAILAHRSGSRSQIQRVYDRDTRMPLIENALLTFEEHLRNLGLFPQEPLAR